MDNVSDVRVVPMIDSNFVKPLRLEFMQNGKKRIWDLVKVHESVSILLFNISRRVLVLVKQFRPAVYYSAIPNEDKVTAIDTAKYPASIGFTLELCAGIVDKDKSLAEIAAEEVLEECGYKIDSPNTGLERIVQFRSGVGISGDLQTLFYAEVTDEMKASSGGGNVEEGEFIEVVEVTIEQVKQMMSQPSVTSPGGFLFALQWFLSNKASQYS